MNELDHEKILDSIARLTEKRNRLSLEICLTQTMFDLLAVDEIALYQVENDQANLLVHIDHKGVRVLDSEVSEPEDAMTIADDVGFVACLEGCEAAVEPTAHGAIRYTFPIPSQERLVGFLRLLAARELNDDLRLIKGFVQIYWNYLKLIEDNERDKLTGLLNRKSFDEKLMYILRASQRTNLARDQQSDSDQRQQDTGSYFWLAVLDIDHFKRINDTYGHLYGDEVLILMSNIMRRSFRRSDLLFRYGGEEFVVVLRTRELTDAYTALERFRDHVERHHFPQVEHVTVSIGFTQILASELAMVVISRADKALYYAKEHGRNQIHCYETLVTDGALPSPDGHFGDIELF